MSLSCEAQNTVSSSHKVAIQTQFLQGGIYQSELIDSLERLGIRCIIHQGAGNSAASTLSIEHVRLGSSAYYGGAAPGDVIKDLHKLGADTFSLTIGRAGKTYQINLREVSEPFSAGLSEAQANQHRQLGIDYARRLLYGKATDIADGADRSEITKQLASISALKTSTLLHGQETASLLQGSASGLGLSAGIRRFTDNIEILNPSKASFLNINMCMAPPTDPYGKLQWNALMVERNQSSALGTAWDKWQRNLGDYICRCWATNQSSSSGVVVYHVILKNNGQIGEIKLMPVAELSNLARDGNLTQAGYDLIKKLNGTAILFFPHLTQVTEVHLEIGLINKD
jgi:hypothetical protein